MSLRAGRVLFLIVPSEYASPVIIWPRRLMKYSLKFSRGDSEELKEYLLQPFSSRKDCQTAAAARCCAPAYRADRRSG